MQHLPFILEADAMSNPDDKVTLKTASDKVTASRFMADLLSGGFAKRKTATYRNATVCSIRTLSMQDPSSRKAKSHITDAGSWRAATVAPAWS
jgi:hypothetical protein